VHSHYTHRSSALPEGPLGGLSSLTLTNKGSWIHFWGEGRQASNQLSDASTPSRIWDPTISHCLKQWIWPRTGLCRGCGWCTALCNLELHARNDDDDDYMCCTHVHSWVLSNCPFFNRNHRSWRSTENKSFMGQMPFLMEIKLSLLQHQQARVPLVIHTLILQETIISMHN